MKFVRVAIVFLFVAVLTASSLGAKELFTLSHSSSGKELKWETTFIKVEPIEFHLDALVKGAPYVRSEENSTERLEIVVDGIRYSLLREFLEKRHHDDFSWFGKVEGAEFLSHFTVVDGAVAGEISLPFNTPFGFRRSLLTRGGQTHLIEWNDLAVAKMLADDFPGFTQQKLVAQVSAVFAGGRRRSVDHPSNCSAENLMQTIDHLVVYTESARAWFSEEGDRQIRAFAQNGVDATNATTFNSTGGKNFWVNLVHVALVDYKDAFLSGGWLSDDLEWASRSTEVVNLRNQYKADLVTLLVSKGTTGGLGTSPFSDKAGFSVSVIISGAMTIAHETGHSMWLMGHSPEDWTNPDPVWATDHYVDGVFSGVMATSAPRRFCPNGCPTAWVWANPHVLFKGVPTGILNERENWRMLARMTPMVSRFRLSGNEEKCVASSSLLN